MTPTPSPGGLVGSPLPVCPPGSSGGPTGRPGPASKVPHLTVTLPLSLAFDPTSTWWVTGRPNPVHDSAHRIPGRGPAVGTDKEQSYMHHFTAIEALPLVKPQSRTPKPGARISVFASEGELRPQALQITGTAAELLAFAAGIRDAVHLVEMRQLAESMEPIPGTVTS